MTAGHFSASYIEARERFRSAANSVGARVDSYPIQPGSASNAAERIEQLGEGLTIDVATVGPGRTSTIVVSSGVHGVEGFSGSAVQFALLQRFAKQGVPSNRRYVLVHALNPFGFAELRRFNEDNVDLNRNFVLSDAEYQGAPDGYAALNSFLNPVTPPSRLEPYRLRALWNIWRHGLQAVKQSVAGGQYEYERGLFFGGRELSQSGRIVREYGERWIEQATEVVHIDFHTGLGKFATYKLLLGEDTTSTQINWYRSTFGRDVVEPLSAENATAYRISGMFGAWMQSRFSDRPYRFVCAEFGTYDVVRVLGSIRGENRAHHYAKPDSNAYRRAKLELMECFNPRAERWRTQVVAAGLQIIEQAEAVAESGESNIGSKFG